MKHIKTRGGEGGKPWQWTHTHGGREKRKTNFIVQNKSNLPWFVCSYSFGFCYRSEWKVGQGHRFCLDWVLWGEGSRVRRMALSKGALSALKKRTAAVQENDIRRRSSMQLEERPTFLCAMTNREVVCPYALFFCLFHNYCKMCSFCLQSKTASTSSKQRGCLPERDFQQHRARWSQK